MLYYIILYYIINTKKYIIRIKQNIYKPHIYYTITNSNLDSSAGRFYEKVR